MLLVTNPYNGGQGPNAITLPTGSPNAKCARRGFLAGCFLSFSVVAVVVGAPGSARRVRGRGGLPRLPSRSRGQMGHSRVTSVCFATTVMLYSQMGQTAAGVRDAAPCDDDGGGAFVLFLFVLFFLLFHSRLPFLFVFPPRFLRLLPALVHSRGVLPARRFKMLLSNRDWSGPAETGSS